MSDKRIVKKAEIIGYQQQQQSVEKMITEAIKSGVEVETMERILKMRKELKAEWAKEQFDQAMATFQAECPEIKKTKDGAKTKSGQVAYKYAPIEAIVAQTKTLIAKNGLSYTIKTEVSESKVKSIVVVKHIAGHSEVSEMEVPLGVKTDVMSDSQVVAAASTFSKRYAFVNAFGIMTADEDSEQSLKVDNDEVRKAKEILNRCTNPKDFNAAWNKFSKEVKANRDVLEEAKKIKGFIEDNIKPKK